MSLIVQKFGGTSLRDEGIRAQALNHVRQAKAEGYRVVVVVSAMGRKGEPYATDTFLEWISHNGNQLDQREKDLLLSCGEMISSTTFTSLLNAEGIPAVALTGAQAGIRTNREFGNAQIESIDPTRILSELEQNKVVVVCGFQGGTVDGEMTTLGRGGSDTTATALGKVLKAEYVDIFTDVEGIMTADPRIVKEACSLKTVTYTEICNLAYQGAKVVHPRAVEIAMQSNVPIRVRSTKSEDEGTLVTSTKQEGALEERLNERLITGIAQVDHISQIQVSDEQDPQLQNKVFKAMAKHNISVDFINVNPFGVVYTVHDDHVDQAAQVLKEIGYAPFVDRHCAKVSVIGAGIAGVPGVMSMIVEALTEENIPILQSADSHTTIWVLVKLEYMEKAVQALHRKFKLHKTNL